MKILSRNTVVLKTSLNFSEDGTKVIFQCNTELYVENNPHLDLFTPKTVFNIECPTSQITDIDSIASVQVQEWVDENYNQ